MIEVEDDDVGHELTMENPVRLPRASVYSRPPRRPLVITN